MNPQREPAEPDTGIRLHLLLCVGADFDCAYIPHLCRHYAPAVDSWNVLLHSNELGQIGEHVIEDAERSFESSLFNLSSDTALHTRVWRGEFGSFSKVDRLNDMIRERVPPGEWVIYVDADEFVESPDSLKPLLAQCTADGQTVVYGSMVDRFARDKEPYPILDEDDLFEKFPYREEYTKTSLKAWTHKPCLMKHEGAPLLLNCHDYSGQSWSDYRRSGRPVLTVWHFKWVESTREKLKYRLASFRRQGLGWWEETTIGLKDIYRDESADAWRPCRVGTVHERNGNELIIRLGSRGGVRLNPTAALIWERCDGTRTEANIVVELFEMFDAPEDTLRRDVRAVLNGLIDAGALYAEHELRLGPRPEAGQAQRIQLGLVSETSKAFLNQVKLCLFSLRRNGGALSSLPVTLITNAEPLSEREAGFFEEHFSPIEFRTSPRLGAIPHTSKLNVFYSIDPSEYDVLMFLDCDTVVRQPLDRIADPILNEGAQFVCRRGGKTDRNRFVDFNALVHEFCGPGRKDKILYDGLEEWPMFNSGVFLATSEAVCKIRRLSVDFTYRIFNQWQRSNALEQLPEAVRRQSEVKQVVRESWPIEQGALALACIRSEVRVQYLEEIYNSWGGELDFRILHCFKSLYDFNRNTMFSSESDQWIEEYFASGIPGKIFLASMVREYKRAFHPNE